MRIEVSEERLEHPTHHEVDKATKAGDPIPQPVKTKHVLHSIESDDKEVIAHALRGIAESMTPKHHLR